jgi:hypothetical protein
MTLPVRALRLISSDASTLNRFTYESGEILYDPLNKTLRIFDGRTVGGTILATRDWIQTGTSSLPTASTSQLGGVKIDGTTITINGSGVISARAYTLPTASNGVLGGVKVDNSTIQIDNAGIISYTLPQATNSTIGGVIVDGTTITINNGVISGANTYTLPDASTSVLGGVKIDGTTITVNGSGQIVANYTPYTLPTATTSVLGGVIVDGTTVTITGGVITASPVGSSASRVSVNVTTASLAAGASANATFTGFKGYALYSIQTSAAAWVTLYTSVANRTTDASRAITTDPTPGNGVVVEAITAAAGTQYFSPAIYGYSAEAPPTVSIPAKIYNNGVSATAITVTLTLVRTEN